MRMGGGILEAGFTSRPVRQMRNEGHSSQRPQRDLTAHQTCFSRGTPCCHPACWKIGCRALIGVQSPQVPTAYGA